MVKRNRIKKCSAVVIAAGRGKRMQSRTAKVLHPVAGRPLVWYMVSLARQIADAHVAVVIGHQAEQVRAVLEQSKADFEPFNIVLQSRQLGTGHAVRQAEAVVMPGGKASCKSCLILSADTPLLRRETIERLLAHHEQERATLTLLSATLSDPAGYGRVVRGKDGRVVNVVEERDATPSERTISEVNAGAYVIETQFLFKTLPGIRPRNAQGEHYLTDLVGLAAAGGARVAGMKIADASECSGINTREHLACVEQAMRQRIRTRWLEAGVTMLDPQTTFIDDRVTIGPDTVLYPGVTLEGATTIGAGCVIRSYARVTDSAVGDSVTIEDHSLIDGAVIESHAKVGPFAHLRPGSILRKQAKVGNFVEVKNTELGPGSKANHLTYLGDASVGKRVNIGAGTITCNYDGYRKEQTIIEDEAFIGSATQLIAPVKVEKGAVVGAGSTITRDVPAGALALSRSEQVIHEQWAARRRAGARNAAAPPSAKPSKSRSRAGTKPRPDA